MKIWQIGPIALSLSITVAHATRIDPAIQAMATRDPGRAIRILRSRLAGAEGRSGAAKLQYLLARAYLHAGKPRRALAAARALVKRWPKSPWVHKAIFLEADCYVALKDYRSADDVYLRETLQLVSAKRKEEVATSYLKIADHAYKPGTPDKKPDYAVAERFYRLALGLGLSPARTREIRYRVARALMLRGQGWKAVRELRRFLKDYRKGAFVGDALFTLGRAYQRLKRLSEARKAYRDFLDDHSDHAKVPEATWYIAETFRMPKPRSDRELERGVRAARRFLERFSAHKWAPKAALAVGEAFHHRHRLEEAVTAYRDVVRRFGRAEGRPSPAKLGRKQVARARVRLGDALLAQRKYAEAIATWRSYLRDYPADEDSNRAQRAILDTEFEIAAQHYLARHYAQAREQWTRFAQRYPLDKRNPRVMRLLGQLEYDQGRYAAAIKAWEALVSKYGRHREGSRGHFAMAVTLADKLGDFERAMKELRKVRGAYRWQARAYLSKLQKEALRVVTERIFGADERPRIKVTQRNLKELSLRLYRIDMEAYFRRIHRLDRVDRLDLALIAPDKAWTERIKGFRKWKESTQTLELPVREPGVYAVTIAGGKLETTTVVQVSNLALITKASRHDLLVFAQDARRQRPWPGARILVSNGKKIIFEGETGADGVWRVRDKKLRDLSGYTIFGVAQGHVAGNPSGHIGGAVRVLTPRGLVYTDRPAYQPGEEVSIRAIVRRVQRGSYVFRPGERYRLQVSSPRGDTVVKRWVTLDDFGTTAASFRLSPNAPVGRYAVSLRGPRKQKHRFSGVFLVQRYRLEKVRLDVVFSRPVFMRGEKLTGKIRARYQFGEPVAGKKVTYQLTAEGIERSGVLDAQGELAFSFKTRNYDWDQVLRLNARLPEEGVARSAQVRLATEEFVASAKVERPVYLAGDEALVTLVARDVLKKPRAVRFDVDVLLRPAPSRGAAGPNVDPLTRQSRREFQRKAGGEIRVRRFSVQTAANTGKATFRVRLQRGGVYIFRAKATDRFGNTILATAQATSSGQDDAVRLRLFTPRGEYRVGEQATVRVHSRASGERLALVTFEAEGVVGYRIVRLRAGPNPLRFTVKEAHAPNFRLAVALLDGADLRQAAADFRVRRGLSVKVAALPATARPGDKVKVRLKVTDQNGKPVKASLSLAVVDEALFQLFPDQVAEIGPLFYGQSRDISFATAASRKYRHQARTRKVSEELLAEEKRRDQARREGRKRRAKKKTMSLFEDRAKAAAELAAPVAKPAPPPSAGGKGFGVGGGGAAGYGRAMARRGLLRFGSATRGPAPAVRVRSKFRTLAHWSPSVVTDARGEATVEVTLPDNTTTWRLTTRGVDQGTLVGQAKGKVVSKEDFFVEARFPRVLTEGDRVQPLVRVHNFTGKPVTAAVSTRITLGKTTVSREGQVEAPARGAGEAALALLEAGRFEWGAKNEATVRTRAVAGSNEDVEKIKLPLLPWGSERRVAASGSSAGSVSRTLSLGDGRFQARSLTVHLGPPPNRLLVSMALSRQGLRSASPASLAQWVLITLDVLRYLRAQRRGGAATEKLAVQLEALTRSLVAVQARGGGFAWAGKRKANPFVSAQALRALVQARAAGAPVPERVLQRLIRYVGRQFRSRREREHEAKAALLYALAHLRSRKRRSVANVDPFASANRLYRLRRRLSPTALSYLTLTFDRLGRRAEVKVLAQRLLQQLGGSYRKLLKRSFHGHYLRVAPWFRGNLTRVALAVDAIQRGAPNHAMVGKGVRWLLRHRWGFCWFSPRLTQAAIQALARYYGRTRFSRDRYRVAIRVNDQDVKTVEVRADGSLRKIVVPPRLLRDGKNKLQLTLSGRGRFTYAAVLRGFTRGIDRAHENRHVRVTRHYQPAPRRFEGKPLARGFGILTGKYKRWENRLGQLPLGEKAEVRIEIKRRGSGRPGWLVVEEPIPAGTRVDPDSVRGSFLHHEIRRDRIVFLVDVRWRTRLYYDLFGVYPGKYRVLPTRVVAAYDPAFLSTGKEASLEVLDKGQESKEPYRPTPDEDFALGKALYEKKRFAQAAVPLERLLSGHGSRYTIRDRAYKEIVKMLLYVALEAKQADRVVRYFEILKERYPELVIPLQKSVRIARAYVKMGEFERGYQVLRATAEASFNVESQVGGRLDENGKPINSVRFVRKLVQRYPDLPVVQTATYGLAQHLVGLEKRAKTEAGLKKLKLEPGALLDDAIRIFWEYMAMYPRNPTVDEAGFALANAYLKREENQDVISLTRRLRRVLRDSTFLDGYDYLQALAAFALERYDAALKLCRRVATGKYLNEQKERVESRNKDLAIFIMGQIFHALGRPRQAIARYRKVKGRFTDAREAIENFQRLALSIPEVTTAAPGARVSFKVRFRNVTDVTVVVYRVDLMKLYLIHRDLNNITKVNLAGIHPLVQREIKLAAERGYRDQTRTVDLPLRKKGAYLVVLKGKEVEASGMVLVTDLRLEVQEEEGSERVRVQVLDRRRSKPVRKVFVRVVGSTDGKFKGAKTDLRGVYVADGVEGAPTVIAAKGDSYAFYRGRRAAAAPRKARPRRRRYWRGRRRPAPRPTGQAPKQDLMFELERRNIRIQQKARQFYKQQLRNKAAGVEVQQLK